MIYHLLLINLLVLIETKSSLLFPVIMNSRAIAAVSQVAFPRSWEFVNVEMFTPANQNVLFEVTTIIQPVKTDLSEDSDIGLHRMTIF